VKKVYEVEDDKETQLQHKDKNCHGIFFFEIEHIP
jgi:hypothetical protein